MKRRYTEKPDTHPCNCCGEILPFTEEFFYSNKQNKFGLNFDCKTCWAEIRKEGVRRNPWSTILRDARRRARDKNLPFNIDAPYLQSIAPTHCKYLEYKLEYCPGKGVKQPNSASLDKIIPELGYIKGNVQFISDQANTMKNYATEEQLLTFCQNVLAENNRKNNF